ncbi:F-box domain containing protein [Trema orientale]|uniref:F-box domain containing protein n=1 Tax=Trema orientale TaxID=63057 RepID=A0A2P5CRV6_TREOI|nr:F-box domain containing protein [Trema orientale]
MGNNKEEENMIEDYLLYLPNLVLYEIFAKLPAEHIIELRHSSKYWNEVTTRNKFIEASFLQSEPSLLIQVASSIPRRLNFKLKLLELDESRLCFKLKRFVTSRMGKVRSTCNGLLLVNDTNHKKILLVANFVTKCCLTLPPCPSGCPHRTCGSALVFDPYEKRYKVIHIYADSFGFEVFTLGSSEWKIIPGPFHDHELHNRPFDERYRWSDPLSTDGQLFLHWKVASDSYIISMDACKETFRKTHLPHHIDKKRYSLLEMNGYLALISNVSSTQFDVWVLKNYQEQIWHKSYSILADSISYLDKNALMTTRSMDLDPNALPDFKKLEPVVSLRNRNSEVIVLRHQRSGCWYIYETKFKVLNKLKNMMNRDCNFIHYKSSLVHWKYDEELLARETI